MNPVKLAAQVAPSVRVRSWSRSLYAKPPLLLFGAFSLMVAAAGLSGCAGYVGAANSASNGGAQEPAIGANPSTVNFGSVIQGNTDTQPITISNSGTGTLIISKAAVSGSGFSANGVAMPVTIPAGGSTPLTVAFTPDAASTFSGSMSLSSNAASSPFVISLSGTGVAATRALSVNPPNLVFGNITVGNTTSQNVTLTNSGNSNVTISRIAVSGTGFSATGVSSGAMLTPNQTAKLSVLFSPAGTGTDSGSVSITSNAANSPQAISLSGAGVAQYSVTLNWQASSSSGVLGYNVYRGTTSGVYTLINASLVAPTSYTDSSVESGQNITYYYVVTAVDSSGEESTDSNQATAVVP